MKDDKKNTGFAAANDLFSKYQVQAKPGYISQEFQDFGYRLAVELDDLAHKSLYIRMAKKIPRQILEAALSYVADANARSKAKLFMWKLKQLRAELDKKPTTLKPK